MEAEFTIRRIFVTGGSGFVGSAVVGELLARGYGVNALVNRTPVRTPGDVRSFPGGLFDAAAVDAAVRGCDAAVHLVGIIAEDTKRGVTFERMHVDGTRAVLDAAARAGVRRLVHMSALGTRPDAVSDYHRTKWRAEELVRASGLDWTILRPSLIHGPGGEFMQMAARWARGTAAPFLFMPYFSDTMLPTFGTGRAGALQPVFVGDVARAFSDAVEKPVTVGQTYALAGAEQLTWTDLHRAIAKAVRGRPRLVASLPAWYATLLTRVLPARLLPFNRDQVVMSQENNTADVAPFVRDFGWAPRPFRDSLHDYATTL
ncbi:MAG TPA: NAD(P)H-binding protein [Tepidisphaeraceae bacterium]|nr:NAD(P)H-binding protein [Tepidisphaeraceae bacterium]